MSTLKQPHRLVRDKHPANLTPRIYRALSWLNRAEQADDADGRFIFLWIAFNAAYAQEIEGRDDISDKVCSMPFWKSSADWMPASRSTL